MTTDPRCCDDGWREVIVGRVKTRVFLGRWNGVTERFELNGSPVKYPGIKGSLDPQHDRLFEMVERPDVRYEPCPVHRPDYVPVGNRKPASTPAERQRQSDDARKSVVSDMFVDEPEPITRSLPYAES